MIALPGYRYRQKPPLGAGLLTGHPLAQGLGAKWLVNESAGGVLTDIAGRYNATAHGTPLWRPSPLGPALDTSGGCYWEFDPGAAGSVPPLSTPRMTIEAWLKLPTTGGGGHAALATGDNSGMLFAYDFSTTGLRFYARVNGSYQFITLDASPTGLNTRGDWHHYAATYDGAALRVYVDSVLRGSLSAAGSLTYTGTYAWSIGNYFGVASVQVAEASIYTRALLPGEVEQLYDDSYQMVAPPAMWRLAAVQAAGGVTLNATGSPTAQAATVSGAASVPLNAAGSASAQAATVLGAASVPLNAAGAASAGSAAAAGVASVPLNATGNPTAQSAVSTGAASVPLNAGGSVSSQAATAAGAGTVSLPGLNADGAVTPGAATSAGLASIPLSALGFMTARQATAAGAVSIPLNAAGAVFALAAAASGAGTIVQGPTVRRFYFVRAGRVYIVKGK